MFLAQHEFYDEIRAFELTGGITPLEAYTSKFALMARYAPDFNRKQRKRAYRQLSMYQLLLFIRRLRLQPAITAIVFTQEIEYAARQ